MTNTGESSRNSPVEALWTPREEEDLQFAGNVIHALAYSLTKESRPRLGYMWTGFDWADKRSRFIRNARMSGHTMGSLAEFDPDGSRQENLLLAKRVLNGIARHTQEHRLPRLDLRVMGIDDRDRVDFGINLYAVYEDIHQLQQVGVAAPETEA